jgi:hypothetical protein
MGWDGMDWSGEDRDKCSAPINVVMNFRIPQNAEKNLSGSIISALSSSSHIHTQLVHLESKYSEVRVI